jgi:uncharacterized coiled-coil protein SlyX
MRELEATKDKEKRKDLAVLTDKYEAQLRELKFSHENRVTELVELIAEKEANLGNIGKTIAELEYRIEHEQEILREKDETIDRQKKQMERLQKKIKELENKNKDTLEELRDKCRQIGSD